MTRPPPDKVREALDFRGSNQNGARLDLIFAAARAYLDGEAWQQIETAPKDGAEAATKEVEVWRLEMARWDKGTLPEWSAEIINFGSEGAAHECARNLRSGSTHNREWTRFDCIRVTGPHKQTVPA